MKNLIKCNLNHCLNHSNGYCEIFIPTTIKKLKPNDKTCFLYEDSVINLKLKEQLKHKRSYDESLSEEQVEKIEKVKKKALENMKKKAKENENGIVVKKPKSKLNKFVEN